MSHSNPNRATVKPGRYVRLVRHPEPEQPGRLLIFEGIRKIHIDDYLVTELASDWGIAFQLEKTRSTRKGWKPETYNVSIDGTLDQCDCRGHERWSHCKHVECLRMLLDNGSLVSLLRLRLADEETLEMIQIERFSGPDLD